MFAMGSNCNTSDRNTYVPEPRVRIKQTSNEENTRNGIKMGRYLLAYLVTMVIFFAIDFIWLGTVAKSFYRNEIGPLLLDNFNIPVAMCFYVMYVAGIIVFAVSPALDSGSLRTALLQGALFGFFTYATYDFTNLATLKGYTTKVAIVDTIWGTFLVAATSVAATWITCKLVGAE